MQNPKHLHVLKYSQTCFNDHLLYYVTLISISFHSAFHINWIN
jgi:hypothetical protein